MNWFLFLPMIIQSGVQVAELLLSEKGSGKKKKKVVVDTVSATIQEGVKSGTLRGSWDQVTPEFIGTMVELVGEAKGVFSRVVSGLQGEGVNAP